MDFLKGRKFLPIVGAISIGVIVGILISTLLSGPKQEIDSFSYDQNLLSNSFSDAVNKASPAVVNIYSEILVNKTNDSLPFSNRLNSIFGLNKTRIQSSLGSGVIFSSDGYILTNDHVVNGAKQIIVRLFGDRAFKDVPLVGTDPTNDIAALKINTTEELTPLPLADSD